MQRHWKLAGALSAMLIAGLLVAPAGSAAAQGAPAYEVLNETYNVETRHGIVYMEVNRPVLDGKDVKAPVVLTYSPYSALGGAAGTGMVSLGYAQAYAHLVGTGNSGGCYDYGGIRERESGADLVEFLAKQKWSTGKIGMIGGSYDGTTAIAAATEAPPHLTTIVPEAAISRWYEYAYSGGIRYAFNNEKLGNEGPTNGLIIDEQGFDTPVGFDFGFAMPPPTDVQDPTWADKMQSTITPCDEVEHVSSGYNMDTPNYNEFWLERDYIKDAGDIRIPVLIGANWGDWNVKQEESWNLFHALKKSPKRVLYMGTRWAAHGTPGGDYGKTVQAWFDHYLMGKKNNIQKMPSVVSQMSDREGPGEFAKGMPKVRNIKLYAQWTPRTNPDDYEWKLLPSKPMSRAYYESQGPLAEASFPSAGINTESHASHHSRSDHDWWSFESLALKKNMRMFGNIKVQIYSTAYREWITYTPSIFEMDPDDHQMVQGNHVNTNPEALVGVTRGWLDSRYRKSLAEPIPIDDPAKPFSMTVVAKPVDYTFTKGNTIMLNIQTEINEWSVPKPNATCTDPTNCPFLDINWLEGKTRLIIPVVNGPKKADALFDHAGHHH
ncbi:MAG TPA: CocE/NonD family hydrolase [Actinomycetota bacterium]